MPGRRATVTTAITVPMRQMTKPIHAAADAANGTAQARRRHRIAETHREERGDHVGHRRPVQGHRGVVRVRVVERRRQRAAHQHLPGPQQHRRQEQAERHPDSDRAPDVLLFCTARPFQRALGRELVLRHDAYPRPHGVMTEAAKLVTRHLVLARLGEARAHLGDEARHDHRVDVGVGEQEAVHDIGAGQAELHRRIRRHADAMRHEIILLGNQPHRGGAVGLDRRAEIALDELAAEMQASAAR